MFIGEYHHNLDQKGRVAIPIKFRERLNEGAIMTRGLDNCLFLFDASAWEKLAEKLINLPLAQSNSRAFTRLMLAGAQEAEQDSQGRVLIPEYLRQYAGLEKQVIIAGLYNRIEIWNFEKWREYSTSTEVSSVEIAEKLGELGI